MIIQVKTWATILVGNRANIEFIILKCKRTELRDKTRKGVDETTTIGTPNGHFYGLHSQVSNIFN